MTLPNLTIRQLQTFREVMRSGSISEASRTVGRTQPAVSTMIATLEGELGFALFQREKGRLLPTPEAHFFLEEAEAILDRLDRTARIIAEIGTQDRGNLRIACHPAASGFFLPQVLAGFLQTRPRVKADLMMRASQVVEDLIASQEYDIGLAEVPPPRASILIETFQLDCVIALPEHDPLAARAQVTAADLHRRAMAVLFAEHPITIATEAAFVAAGARLDKRFVLRTFLPALQLVSAGLCVAVVDRITALTTPSQGVVFRPFRPDIPAGLALLLPAHRPLSMLSRAFRDTLREALERLAEPPLSPAPPASLSER